MDNTNRFFTTELPSLHSYIRPFYFVVNSGHERAYIFGFRARRPGLSFHANCSLAQVRETPTFYLDQVWPRPRPREEAGPGLAKSPRSQSETKFPYDQGKPLWHRSAISLDRDQNKIERNQEIFYRFLCRCQFWPCFEPWIPYKNNEPYDSSTFVGDFALFFCFLSHYTTAG